MKQHGNDKGNVIWAKNVPIFYRRPRPEDAQYVNICTITLLYLTVKFMGLLEIWVSQNYIILHGIASPQTVPFAQQFSALMSNTN